MSISDRIAVMNEGRIEQFGTPEDIYARPSTRYVATFIGSPRIELACGEIIGEAGGIACRVGSVTIPLSARGGLAAGREVDIGIRPEHVKLGEAGIPATVRLVQPVGPATHVTLDWEGGMLLASIPGFVRLNQGAATHAQIEPRHLLIFDRRSGELLS